eukprot:SAG25_NODE_2174_length_1871_cov_1.130361_1_plen_71_part_10
MVTSKGEHYQRETQWVWLQTCWLGVLNTPKVVASDGNNYLQSQRARGQFSRAMGWQREPNVCIHAGLRLRL